MCSSKLFNLVASDPSILLEVYWQTFYEIWYGTSNAMEQNPSWEANSCTVGEEISDLCGTWKYVTLFTDVHHVFYLNSNFTLLRGAINYDNRGSGSLIIISDVT
jgi:hypothetical protein